MMGDGGGKKEGDGSADVERYLERFCGKAGKSLRALRQEIRKAAPEAEECLSYGVPAVRMGRILVMYAGFKNHVGFYPTPSAMERFKDELSGYDTAKGTVRFPLDQPLPFALVRKSWPRA